jgi:hypothetical protein
LIKVLNFRVIIVPGNENYTNMLMWKRLKPEDGSQQVIVRRGKEVEHKSGSRFPVRGSQSESQNLELET